MAEAAAVGTNAAENEQVFIPFTLEMQIRYAFYQKTNDFIDEDPATLCTSTYIEKYLTEANPRAEKLRLFASRLARTVPLTISEFVLDQHHSVCAQPITIKGLEGPKYEEILEDVTGYGESHQQMWSNILYELFKNGECGVLVEAPDQVADNLLDAQLLGERSYQVLFEAAFIRRCIFFESGPKKGMPRDVILRDIDYVDDKGAHHERLRRYFFRLEETEADEAAETALDEALEEIEGEEPEDYAKTYTWQILKGRKPLLTATTEAGRTPFQFLLTEDGKYEIVDERDTKFTEIPFVPFGRGPRDSLIRRTIAFDKGLLNTISARTNTDVQQAFQKIFITGVKDDQQDNQVSEYSVGMFKEADVRITAIQPSEPISLDKWMRFLINWGQRLGMMEYKQLMDDTRAVQSAESKTLDLIPRIKFYNETLDRCEPLLNRLYSYHIMIEDPAAFEAQRDKIAVTVIRDFGLSDTEYELERDALVFSWADTFGKAGFAVQQEIFMKYVDQMRLVSQKDVDENERKAELFDLIRAAKPDDAQKLLGTPIVPNASGKLTARKVIGTAEKNIQAEQKGNAQNNNGQTAPGQSK